MMNSSIKILTQAQIDSCSPSTNNDDSIMNRHRDNNNTNHLGPKDEDVEVDMKSMVVKDEEAAENIRLEEDIDEEEMKDALPVSIMLRNCFPPNAYNASERKDRDQINVFDDDKPIINGDDETKLGKSNQNSLSNGKDSNDSNENTSDNNEDEEENDTTLDNYQIFTKTNQWRDQANKIIFLPIEMEIVVTYEFLVQFHSHQKNEHARSRIRDLFGLDVSNENANNDRYKAHGDEKIQNKCKEIGSTAAKERVVVLCSKLQDTRSSHPLWDHVNEKLDDLYDLIPRENDLWSDLYKAMRIQFRAIVPSKADFSMKDDPLLNDASESINCKSSKSILLASCPLHPFKLKPITLSSTKGVNDNSTSSFLIGTSKFRDNVPYAMPPNSILIHYSDGTTRVSPEVFHILRHKNVIDTEASNNQQQLEIMDVDKFARRFDDDAFDVLDDKGYVKAKLQLENSQFAKQKIQNNDEPNESDSEAKFIAAESTNKKINIPDQEACASVDQEKANVTLNGSLNGFSKSISHSVGQQSSRPSSRDFSRGSFTDAFDSMKISSDGRKAVKFGMVDEDDENGEIVESSSNISKKSTIQANSMEITSIDNDLAAHNEKNCENSLHEESDTVLKINELEACIQKLELDILNEEAALRESIESEKMGSICLQDLQRVTEEVEEEIREVEKELERPIKQLQQCQLFVSWRRKEMLNNLSKIYPIQVLPDSVYTIRGIHLPNDMHSLTAVASDEIISAGLGFVCHVVSLCSKYLSIPLRYRVICNSSRSAVRDDVDVFPLFKERVVEKEQFDRAIVLLHRNIDLLIKMSGIPDMPWNANSKHVHILSKLKYLFQGIAENHS